MGLIKRFVVGEPLATSEEQHQRLGRPTALAVFASDAISSTAYATEEILLVLVPLAGHRRARPTSCRSRSSSIVLLAIVITSYRQTIFAYPSGGGSYVVSRENLGADAVARRRRVAARRLHPHRRRVDLGRRRRHHLGVPGTAARTASSSASASSLLMMLANLRGTKESGRLFAGPTYTLHDHASSLLIGVGLFRATSPGASSRCRRTPRRSTRRHRQRQPLLTGITVLMAFLRAFSSGAVALTGVEAISNGVPAFKKPESHNAATTLDRHGLHPRHLLHRASSVLAHHLKPTVSENETLLSIHGARAVLRRRTRVPLLRPAVRHVRHPVLAANTAFADFPRLSLDHRRATASCPASSANRGDRLVFSNGILVLAGVAGVLIVAFGGADQRSDPALRRRRVHRLHALPGRHGRAPPSARRSRAGSATRSSTRWARSPRSSCCIVVVVSKFTYGAWIPVVLIPLIVLGFRKIKQALRPRLEQALKARVDRRVAPPLPHRHRARRLGAPRACSTPSPTPGRCARTGSWRSAS